MSAEGLSRRRALAGAAGLGLSTPLLAACGDGEPTSTDGGSTPTDTGSSPSATSKPPPDKPKGPAAKPLATADEIPVGGGKIFADDQVVVTQPTKGEFKGFSSTCTHEGCTVARIEEGIINCPCHGSDYSIEDGSVLAGPAPSPLPEVPLTVEGDQISTA